MSDITDAKQQEAARIAAPSCHVRRGRGPDPHRAPTSRKLAGDLTAQSSWQRILPWLKQPAMSVPRMRRHPPGMPRIGRTGVLGEIQDSGSLGFESIFR